MGGNTRVATSQGRRKRETFEHGPDMNMSNMNKPPF